MLESALAADVRGTDSGRDSGSDIETESGESSVGGGDSGTGPDDGSGGGGGGDDSGTASDDGSGGGDVGGVGGDICCGSWLPPELYGRVWPPGRGTPMPTVQNSCTTN